jgi:gliding motility-associated-like protein
MKKVTLYIVFIVVHAHCVGQANPPAIMWAKCYGSPSTECAWYTKQTDDGGYVFAGFSSVVGGDVTFNNGSNDVWVARLNSMGDTLWQRSYGGTGSDGGYAMQVTPDGGSIVIAYTNSNNIDVSGNHGGQDFWLVKLDVSGAIEWQKCYGGSSSETPSNVLLTADGGYILIGSTSSNNGDVSGNHGSSDVWVVKVDALGSIQWQKCYGGTGSDKGTSIQETADGGYILVGNSNSTDGDLTENYGGNDVWVVKVDASGTIQWQKSHGGTGSDMGYSILKTVENNYVFVASTTSNDNEVTGNHGGIDFWVAKLNTDGSFIWKNCYGGTGTETPYNIQQAPDGGYIIGGETTSDTINGLFAGNMGGNDYWLVKLTSGGAIHWQRCLGGASNEELHGGLLVSLADNSIVISGHTSSNNTGDVTGYHGGSQDAWVVKLMIDCLTTNSTSNVEIASCETYTGPTGDIYDSTGIYTVIIPNAMGCDSIITINLSISPFSNSDTTITACDSFTWHNQVYTTSNTYYFNDACHADTLNLTINPSIDYYDTACNSYVWLLNGQTYDTSGIYLLEGTCKTLYLTIINNPDVEAGSNQSVCSGQELALSATGATTYTWNHAVQNGSAFIPTFAGYYSVTGTDQFGCFATDSLLVTIIQSPNPSFTPSVTMGNPPLQVSFSNTSTDATSYQWNFGNGEPSLTITNTDSVSTVFTEDQIYTVCLIATNGNCVDTTCHTITVASTDFVIVPNVFSPNGDGVNDLFTLETKNIASFQMTILNRWGNVLKTLNSVEEAWDGRTEDHKDVHEGVYFYAYNAISVAGKTSSGSGFVTLTR